MYELSAKNDRLNCNFNTALTQSYHSQSQIIRILTESWVSEYMYCPHCGNASLNHFPNNKAVADFYCPNCNNEYELKSKAGSIGHKIADGAYHTFIDRITSNNNPDFFILNYSKQLLTVNNLWIIPKHFFVPDIIEQRKPLSDNAQRKGWIGCNILIDTIPSQAKIDIIHNSVPVPQELVQAQVQQASLLYTGVYVVSVEILILHRLLCNIILFIPSTSNFSTFSSTSWSSSAYYSFFTICISLNCIPKNVYSISLISSKPIDAYILRATVFSNDTLIYSLSALCFLLK